MFGDMEEHKYVQINETDKALLVGLEIKRIPTPGLKIEEKDVAGIITYAKTWLPKSKCLLDEDSKTLAAPTWMLQTKGLDQEENHFMVFDTDGGF